MSRSLDALSRELAGGPAEWATIFALLGPPGAGKTDVMRAAIDTAKAQHCRTIYLDLRPAREIWGLDDFYGWLLARLREGFGNGTFKATARRVDTCDLIGKALGKTKDRVLLAVDHLECVADWCARELVSDLREIQDRSDGKAPWNRLRCVVAGVSSVLELKRRARSPNLQFVVHTLPIYAPAADEIDAATRAQIAAAGVAGEGGLAPELGRLCGGEATFLRALLEHHRGLNGDASVQAAVDALIGRGGEYPEFARPGLFYLLDEEFRRRADDLLAGRPATWCDPTTDIDRYQLAGALICGNAQQREARFRNDLIARFIGTLKEPLAEDAPEAAAGVAALRRIRVRARADLASLLRDLDDAWRVIAGVTGKTAVLAGPRDGRTRHVVRDGEVGLALTLDQPPTGEAMDFEVRDARIRARHGEHWVLDVEFVRDDVVTGVRVECCPEWVPSVAARETCRLWALFLTQMADEIERLGIAALGRAAAASRLPEPRNRVFVSSTSADLREHRRAVLDQIVRLDLRFRGMEHFGADPERNYPADKCREVVRNSDVYLGIFGMRYGSLDQASGLSMTEIELREAEKRTDMPMLIYVFGKAARVEVGQLEADPDSRMKLDTLLTRLKARYTVFEFDTVDTLAKQVYQDLNRLRQ